MMEKYEAVVNREVLKLVMFEQGFSNQKLADLAGCSKGTIGGLLTKRNKCSLDMALNISEALGERLEEEVFFTITAKEGK